MPPPPSRSRVAPSPETGRPTIVSAGRALKTLTQAAKKVGASLYLPAEHHLGGSSDQSAFDEDSLPHPDAVTQSALDGERIALETGQKTGMAVGVLRCGWFYGPDSPHTRMLADGLRNRHIPILGDGEAVWSCLHTEKYSRGVPSSGHGGPGRALACGGRPARGGPGVPHRLRPQARGTTTRRVPVWLARLVAGRYAVRFLTASTRTSNVRIRRDLGWSPRCPTFEDGLDQVVSRWREQGEDKVDVRWRRGRGNSGVSQPRRRPPVYWTGLIAIIVILGLGLTPVRPPHLPGFVAAYAGDTLWALAAFLGIGLILPRASTWRVALLAMSFSALIEVGPVVSRPLDRLDPRDDARRPGPGLRLRLERPGLLRCGGRPGSR